MGRSWLALLGGGVDGIPKGQKNLTLGMPLCVDVFGPSVTLLQPVQPLLVLAQRGVLALKLFA
jgi:hypothetical protein